MFRFGNGDSSWYSVSPRTPLHFNPDRPRHACRQRARATRVASIDTTFRTLVTALRPIRSRTSPRRDQRTPSPDPGDGEARTIRPASGAGSHTNENANAVRQPSGSECHKPQSRRIIRRDPHRRYAVSVKRRYIWPEKAASDSRSARAGSPRLTRHDHDTNAHDDMRTDLIRDRRGLPHRSDVRSILSQISPSFRG
jgi:hypothetical protein